MHCHTVFMQDQVRNRVSAIMALDPRHPERRTRRWPAGMLLFAVVTALYSLAVSAQV